MTRRQGLGRARRERMRFPAIPCAGCGVEFEPVREWHQHCSDRCRARVNRERRSREVAETIRRLKRLAGIEETT